MLHRLLILLAGGMLTACTTSNDLEDAPVYLGNFHLGHNVVVAPNLTKGPVSRDASKDEWIAAMKKAVDERFSRYDGTRLYHFGVSLEGYVLAVPGIPVVASPKSALILRVTAWDDEKGGKLNAEPETLTVLESFSGSTVVGSGLTQSKEKQIENLTKNAAKQIEIWLVKQNNATGWFEDDGIPARNKPQGRAAQARIEAAEEELQPVIDLPQAADGQAVESPAVEKPASPVVEPLHVSTE